MPFRFERLELGDVILVHSFRFADARGSFGETYRASVFRENGIPDLFVQDNVSYSVQNVLRGLHYQKSPQAQGKYVTVSSGEIFDVAVDLRKDSATFGKWVGITLSDKNGLGLYIPAGFAHGFCVTGESAIVTYKVTSEYAPEWERGIVWNDPDIHVSWPVSVPLLSERDRALPLLRDAEL